MPHGPGKYDQLATFVRTAADASGVIVIVVDGCKGSGFEVQLAVGTPSDVLSRTATMLRQVADQLEASGHASQN